MFVHYKEWLRDTKYGRSCHNIMEPKYKIGQEIKNTIAIGDCKVTDVFKSITNENSFVYSVVTSDGDDLVCFESELNSVNQ